MKVEGIIVPVITPFNANDEVDYAALAAVLEHLIAAGVHGIVACGSTGEYYTFNDEERQKVLAFVAEKVQGRALLVAGVNDTYTAGSLKKVEQAKALGYQAVMLAPPIYCLPNQQEIVQHYKTVSTVGQLPIIMYNFPARSGVEISVESVIELSREEYIVGIKESSGDFTRALTLLNTDFENFEVVCGSDDQGADYLFWGARSWIGGAANYLPEAHVQMIDAAKAGDFTTVRETMRSILPVIQNMESSDYNQKAKLGLEHRGVAAGEIRAPLMAISETEKTEFLQLLAQAL